MRTNLIITVFDFSFSRIRQFSKRELAFFCPPESGAETTALHYWQER